MFIPTLRELKGKITQLQERWRGARRAIEQLRQEIAELRRQKRQLEREREQWEQQRERLERERERLRSLAQITWDTTSSGGQILALVIKHAGRVR